MITLNNSMCGATENFPETVLTDLEGQTLVFDYTPDSAGWSGPGPFCEGYIQRDPIYGGMYDLFAEMPDYWLFYDGMSWWSDCTLINGVDGAAGFTIGDFTFVPESVTVRTGSAARPSGRALQRTRGAAFMKALVERLHADHGVRLGTGTKATFPHLTSARDGMGTRTPVVWPTRARQDALHRVRIMLRAPQAGITQARHDAFTRSGWRLLARNTATLNVLDLGFVPARNDGLGGSLADVALPDGDWQIEPRPADWFWSDCRGRAVTSVSIQDGCILHAGLPAILNLHGEIANQRRIVRWEIATELLPQAFQFGIWTGAASPVNTTGPPLATVPFSTERGSYLHAFTQSEPLYLAVAAFDADGMGPEAEIFLDWASAPPASPVNQLAR